MGGKGVGAMGEGVAGGWGAGTGRDGKVGRGGSVLPKTLLAFGKSSYTNSFAINYFFMQSSERSCHRVQAF